MLLVKKDHVNELYKLVKKVSNRNFNIKYKKRKEYHMTKYVYLFKEGDASMRNLLGGKGANLAEMTALGIAVPQGFTVTTEACNDYYAKGKVISPEIISQIFEALEKLKLNLVKNLEMPKILYWFLFAQVHVHQCLA
jgi:hypothetical protein